MQLRRFVTFAAFAIVVLALDQGSKAWAHTLTPGPHSVVDGYWEWQLAYNDGAAFSTFTGQSAGRIVLSILAIVAVIAVGVAAVRTPHRARRIAYGVIAGGALGNLVDRLRDGAVTDFVRWRIHDHLWPLFNVADAALLVGVAVLLLTEIIERRSAARLTVQT
jgi:signal peptidase II